MFRKKQTPPQSQRNVRAQQSAQVFSYYASRSSEPAVVGRTMTPRQTATSHRVSKDTLKYAPSMIAAVMLIVSLVYMSTLSTLPNVQLLRNSDQTLKGNRDTYEKEAQNILNRSPLNRSKLTIDTTKVATEMRAAFPELGDIAVVMPLVGRRLIIQAQPAEPSLVIGTRSGAFVVDVHGRAIVKASEIDSSVRDKLPMVRDESDVGLEPGKSALPETVVTFIADVTAQLKAKNIPVDSMSLPGARELQIRPQNRPYYVRFDTQGEGRLQTGTFIAVKERLEKDNVLPAEYIDVRVPEKAFYK